MKNETKRAIALGAALAAGCAAVVRAARAYELRERVVVISGGSRGLGLQLARECARHGARLVLLARDPVELRRAREELRARGADVLVLRCDVTDRADVIDAMTLALDWYGHIDVL